MPAIFTHIQFGKEVLEGLPERLKAPVLEHLPAFYLGTQGPDILFYHKPFQSKAKNPDRKKGWDLHAVAPEEFFLRGGALVYADENNRDERGNFTPKSAEIAYLIGFLCHFTLDCACHPLIDENSVDGLTHGRIESELDKYQFERSGRPIRGFNAATLYFADEEAKLAASRVLEVSKESMARAMRSMKKINGLFSHKCGLVHGVCHFFLALAGMNKSFGDMFIHKKKEERCTPLLPQIQALFDGAIGTARARITDFFDNLPAYLEKKSLYEDFRYDYSGNPVK